MSSARSWLYVPGNRPDRLASAPGRGADAIIVDLEDAVATADKNAARDAAARWLAGQRAPSCDLWVRVNALALADDVRATTTRELSGIVVPKADAALLAQADAALRERERALSLPDGQFQVVALIETASALLSAARIAAAPRVVHLGLGEADLIAELRLRPSANRDELRSLRLQVVLGAAAAGIGAPIAPASTDFRDLDMLRQSTQELYRLGFRARTAIHPAQIPVINSVFTPDAGEIEQARALVAAFERGGAGASVDEHGRMIDSAVVRPAREVLARAGLPGIGGTADR